MEEKKDWKEELQDIINREMFKEDLMIQIKSLVEQELDRAREEGRREYFSMGMEYFSLIDDSNIYLQKGWKLPEEKAKRLQILGKILDLN